MNHDLDQHKRSHVSGEVKNEENELKENNLKHYARALELRDNNEKMDCARSLYY